MHWLSLQQAVSEDGEEPDDGGSNHKRKVSAAPKTEEERRARRKEINRQSARRIRQRKSNEMESLKQQVPPEECSSLDLSSLSPQPPLSIDMTLAQLGVPLIAVDVPHIIHTAGCCLVLSVHVTPL